MRRLAPSFRHPLPSKGEVLCLCLFSRGMKGRSMHSHCQTGLSSPILNPKRLLMGSQISQLCWILRPWDILSATWAISLCREEGSNGDREMSAAIWSAGMRPWDITMSDLLQGRASLNKFKGVALLPLLCDFISASLDKFRNAPLQLCPLSCVILEKLMNEMCKVSLASNKSTSS